MSDFKPYRVDRSGNFFKPHPETVWVAPDAGGEDFPSDWILRAAFTAYCDLLMHPCGIEMLRSARRGWKAIRREEQASEGAHHE